MSKGYVYLMHAETGHHKIGLSKDPRARLRAFRIEMPLEDKLLHVFPAENMAAAEKALHRKFAAKRFRGEWFLLEPDDVRWFLSIGAFDHERDFVTLDGPTDDNTQLLFSLLSLLAFDAKAAGGAASARDDDLAVAFSEELKRRHGYDWKQAADAWDESLNNLVVQGVIRLRLELIEWDGA